jgi:nucleotide-binding universal stress UspA family protein
VLIVMSTTRWSKRMHELGLHEVQEAAKRQQAATLDVLYVVEQDEIDRAARSVGASGFLGRDVQDELVGTLLAEHERVAERRKARVRKALEDLGCESAWTQVVGDYEGQVHEAVSAGHYDVVILVQSQLSFLERLFHGSEDDRVARWVRAEGHTRVVVEPGV